MFRAAVRMAGQHLQHQRHAHQKQRVTPSQNDFDVYSQNHLRFLALRWSSAFRLPRLGTLKPELQLEFQSGIFMRGRSFPGFP